MKRTIIAVSLLLSAGLLTGCNKGKDGVLPDGTKFFGERMKDGIRTAERVEYSDGQKEFDVTWLKDGSVKIGRLEFPNGGKAFDVTILPDQTEKAGRVESPDGRKQFDVTFGANQTQAVQTVGAASASAGQSETAASQTQGKDTDNSDRARETQTEVEYAVNKEMLSLISSLSRPKSDQDPTPKVVLTRMIPSLRLPRLVCGERQRDLTLECKSGDWEFDFFPMSGRADAFTALTATFAGAGNKTFNGWADAFRDIYKTGFTEEDKSGADDKLLSWSSAQRTICIDGSQHCPRTALILEEKTGEHPEVSITLTDALAFTVEVTLKAQPEWKRIYTSGH